MRPPSLTLLCAVTILSGGLPAQELLWEKIGVKDVEWIGMALAQVGDLDGDGYEDLVTIFRTWSGGTSYRLRFLSGKTGKTLLEFDPKVTYLWPLVPTGTGDMDGNNVPDFAVRIYDVSYRQLPHKVEVRSGKTGKLIWSVQQSFASGFGSSILGDLDLDGDKLPDLVVASRYLLHPTYRAWIGGVWAFDNKGKLLYKLTGVLAGVQIGLDLGKVGDVDGDGKDDFVVGTNGNVAAGYGSAMLVSGSSGKILRHGIDKTVKSMVGLSVDGVGDIDRDGVPDFAASGGFAGQYPMMQVFSGRTGKILLQVQKPGQTHEISGRGFDFDKDGVPDVVRNALAHRAPGRQQGSVFVLSGRDGKVLAQADRDWRTSAEFADHVLALKPPPGSDLPLFAIAQPRFANNNKTNYQGRIAVYRGTPSGVADFGTNCKGPAARSRPEIGLRNLDGKQRIRLQLTKAKPGSTAFLFLGYSNTKIGASTLPFKLDNFGFPGCSLLTSSDVILPILTGRSGIDAGYGRFDLNARLAFPGKITLYGQWAFIDNSSAGVWGFTRGLLWRH